MILILLSLWLKKCITLLQVLTARRATGDDTEDKAVADKLVTIDV